MVVTNTFIGIQIDPRINTFAAICIKGIIEYAWRIGQISRAEEFKNGGNSLTLQIETFHHNFKLQNTPMSFYDNEQKAIQQDQLDNELIEALGRKYQEVLLKSQTIEKETVLLRVEVQQLKDRNTKLVEEVSQLKETQKHENTDYEGAKLMSTSEKCEFYSTMQKTPQGLMRNIDKLNSTQQTKRRVINGFVGEMSLELAESEQLLKRQRKMQEETRLTLQLCNEEVSTVRIANKQLQNEVLALTIQNQNLFKELESVIHEKHKMETYCEMKETTTSQKFHTSALLNMSQFDNEMDKMDAIYKSIDFEMSILT